MSAGAIQYKLGVDAAPLVKGFAMARSAAAGFTSGLAKIGGLVGGLTGLGAAGSIIGGFVKALTGAAEMETTTVAFETLIGSASQAAATLEGLKKFGAETPFEFPELADAGKKLLAFGSGAGALVPELRMLGDLSAGIGAPIGELAELYGKARTQGRLMAEDVNQLTGRGIPVIAEFAKQFGVSTAEVRGLVESGKIGFPQLQQALGSLTSEGGRFFEMTKKQSTTAAGLWSTLQDSIGEVLREFGKPILTELKSFLTDGIAAAGGLVAKAQEFGQEIADALAIARELYAQGNLGEAFGAGLRVAFLSALDLLIKGLQAAAAGFAAAIVPAAIAFKDIMLEGIAEMGAKLMDMLGKLNPVKYLDHAVWGDIPEFDMKSRGRDREVETGTKAGAAFGKFADWIDLEQAKADFAAVIAPAKKAVEAAREAAKPVAEIPKVAMDGGNEGSAKADEEKKGGARKSGAGNSLASVGGYMGTGTPASERHQRDIAKHTLTTTRLLTSIEKHLAATKPPGTFT